MARWEMAAAGGLMQRTVKDGIAFIVASSAIRFRRELRPMQPFEIHSQVVSASERDMHLLQIAKGGDGNKVYAGTLVRAVLRQGRTRISPRDVLSELWDANMDAPFPIADGNANSEALATLEKALTP